MKLPRPLRRALLAHVMRKKTRAAAEQYAARCA